MPALITAPSHSIFLGGFCFLNQILIPYIKMETKQQLVQYHVLKEQGMIVTELIKSGAITEESICGDWSEVMEWWLVTPYLAQKLRKENEVVIEEWGNNWWGRTTSGQAIFMDDVIARICQN